MATRNEKLGNEIFDMDRMKICDAFIIDLAYSQARLCTTRRVDGNMEWVVPFRQ